MEPYVRRFLDPLEGLEHQLKELAGFSQWVPPLIEQARNRKWGQIAKRPSDGETELVDVYEQEVDREGGSGFADYAENNGGGGQEVGGSNPPGPASKEAAQARSLRDVGTGSGPDDTLRMVLTRFRGHGPLKQL
jgi:hypothetical protein